MPRSRSRTISPAALRPMALVTVPGITLSLPERLCNQRLILHAVLQAQDRRQGVNTGCQRSQRCPGIVGFQGEEAHVERALR